MRKSRLFLVVVALGPALGGCLNHGPQFAPYQYAQPPQAPQSVPAASAYQVPVSTPGYQTPAAQSYPQVAASTGPKPRGFFALNLGGPFVRAPATAPMAPAATPVAPPPVYAAPAAPPPVYAAPAEPPPVYSKPAVPPRAYTAPAMPAAPAATAYASYPKAQPTFEAPYLLDAGDRLRVTVFGQQELTNSYAVDAAGNVTLPLVGSVPAMGMTTEQLSSSLSERLKQGYIREPKVAIEVEAYRPFFIHGDVAAPGQYAYVANMTAENAVAIAGGFGPRADRSKVTLSRTISGQTTRATVPLTYAMRPGDTLRIGERWF
jgi:polysaccharide export outer membrane protein